MFVLNLGISFSNYLSWRNSIFSHLKLDLNEFCDSNILSGLFFDAYNYDFYSFFFIKHTRKFYLNYSQIKTINHIVFKYGKV